MERERRIPLHPFHVTAAALGPGRARGVALVVGWPRGPSAPLAAALGTVQITAWAVDPLIDEEGDLAHEVGRPRFDLDLVAGRILVAADWAMAELAAARSFLAVAGAGPAGAAALVAASERAEMAAVVCAARRPDLAGPSALAAVRARALVVYDDRDAEADAAARRAVALLPAGAALALPRLAHLARDEVIARALAHAAASWLAAAIGGVAELRVDASGNEPI